MTADQFAIVALDQLLSEDKAGNRVQSLQKTLAHTAEQCRMRLDHGVSPDEAKRLNAMMGACSAGLALLPALWQAQQERI